MLNIIHGESRYFFILIFIDVFSRKVVGYYIGTSCSGKDLCYTLEDATKKNKIEKENSLTIRSDNGTQMTSNSFKNFLSKLDLNIDHEFIPPSTPNKNAHVESFNSILEIEFLQTRFFKKFSEAYSQKSDFISFYNERRIHSSLRYKTPVEAYASYLVLIS